MQAGNAVRISAYIKMHGTTCIVTGVKLGACLECAVFQGVIASVALLADSTYATT